MTSRRALLLLPLLLVACGQTSPLAGTWERDDPAADGSLLLMFDRASDQAMACRKGRDGSDCDLKGTYRLQDGKVTLQGTWDDGVAAEWAGDLTDRMLVLRIGGKQVIFRRASGK
jgi:hypothetical protein